MADIKCIIPSICLHHILLEEEENPVRDQQRKLNSTMKEVVLKEILKLLDLGTICLISDGQWVSHVHVVPMKSGIQVVENEKELIDIRLRTGWWVCIDYRKLNKITCKEHFPLPFIDKMLEHLTGNEYFCFLYGYADVGFPKQPKQDHIHMPFWNLWLSMDALWAMQST